MNREIGLGNRNWEVTDINLDAMLSQCVRFCDNPTPSIQAARTAVTKTFRDDYAIEVLGLTYPIPPQGGFPFDP
ncbi:MAG: hypothetical protein IPJ65_43305 [Archangiaceae bacterium]|nr:hypothetical protein [Archangiaceae bacterium]